MSRILVTGASGFIGRQVCRALLARGHEVHALTRAAPPGLCAEPVEAMAPRPTERGASLIWHTCELLAPDAPLEALLKELHPEQLIHLAWYVAHGKYWTASENKDWVTASVRLFKEFRAAGGKRLICAGTCAEYDYTVEGPYSEAQAPALPGTLYGQAKAALRLEAERLAPAASCWVRLFHLYGPGEVSTRLIPRLVAELRAGKNFNLAWPQRLRAFLHVQDAGEAFAALAEAGVSGTYNLGSPRAVTLEWLGRYLAGRLGKEDRLSCHAAADTGNEPLNLTPTLDRLYGALPWRPRIPLEDGLSEYLGFDPTKA